MFFPIFSLSLPKTITMYKRKYIKPEIDISETIIKRSDGGDLTEAKEFVNDWNSKRSKQIDENLQSIGIPFLEDLYKKSLKRNVDTVELADINMPENALGAYHKILHKIDLETDDKDVKVHEVSHSSRPRVQEAKIKQLKAARKFLKDGVVPDDYLDSNNEIYARLMALRKDLKLDPKKHYSISEIRKLIDEHSEYKIGIPSDNGDFRIVTTDSNGNVTHDIGPKNNLDYNKAEIHSVTNDRHSILNRYTPMFIESLINDVADNRKYIPRASSGMSFDIADWWNKLLQNSKSLEYQEFNEKVNSPELYIPDVGSYSTGEDETDSTPTEDTEEVELAYAKAHEGQLPTTTVETEPAKTPVQKSVGQHVYTNGVDYNGFSQKMKGFLDKVASHGISLRVTSGKRAKGSKFSHHENGDAVDFTPVEGQTWETLTSSFLDNTDLMNYVRQNGINLFDERQNTGSKDWTGAHWHVGLDSTQKGGWDKLRSSVAKAQKGIKFITPHPLGQWTSYNDYTTPELPKSVKRHFGKNANIARTIIVELKNAGWNDKQISAYLGNVAAESTGNPHVINSIGAQGLIQRLYDRKEPIRSIPSLDLPVQLGYDIDVMAGNVSRQEMSNEWPRRKQRNKFLNGTGSVKSLTDNLMKNYVRPSKEEQLQSQNKRRQVAYDVYNFLNK